MISSIVRVKDKYVNSNNVSLQQEHIELYVQNRLYSIVLAKASDDSVIKEFKGPELSQLISSAIANGRRKAETDFGTDYYYLGNRS